MLCYAVLRYDMPCYAMFWYAMLCYAMPSYVMPCHAMLPFAMLSQACSGIFRHPQASPSILKQCNANDCKAIYKKKHLIGVAPGSF